MQSAHFERSFPKKYSKALLETRYSDRVAMSAEESIEEKASEVVERQLEEEGIEVLPNSNTLSVPSYQKLQDLLKQQEELLLHQKELFLREYTNPLITASSSSSNPINSSGSTWSFTQGLLLGQLSVFIVVAIFIKFFIFAEPSAIEAGGSKSKDTSLVIVKKHKQKKESSDEMEDELGDTETARRLKVTSILEKTYYDVTTHRHETLDWFNVLIAQMISQLRSEALMKDNIYHSLNDFLSRPDMPDYLDKVKLTSIDLGDDFPIFSNCRIHKSDDGSERLEAKIDVDLADTLTLGIETKLLLNHPMPLTAVLPIQLSVSIVRFSGCLSVSLINTNDQEFIPNQSNVENESSTKAHSSNNSNSNIKGNHDSEGTALMFSFSPDYRLEFTVKSLIGARAKLQDVPKISSLIESKLRSWFIERCIEPRFQVIKLPSLWPRSKNTREPIGTGGERKKSSDPNSPLPEQAK